MVNLYKEEKKTKTNKRRFIVEGTHEMHYLLSSSFLKRHSYYQQQNKKILK